MNVVFDETHVAFNKVSVSEELEKPFEDLSIQDKDTEVVANETQKEPEETLPQDWKFSTHHPQELIIGDVSQGVRTRSSLNALNNLAFVSQIEPKTFKDAECDEFWLIAMQEELNQFERNNVWELVPRPSNHSVIGTKWVFKNKMDENMVILLEIKLG